MIKHITTNDNSPALIGTGYMVALLDYIRNLDGVTNLQETHDLNEVDGTVRATFIEFDLEDSKMGEFTFNMFMLIDQYQVL